MASCTFGFVLLMGLFRFFPDLGADFSAEKEVRITDPVYLDSGQQAETEYSCENLAIIFGGPVNGMNSTAGSLKETLFNLFGGLLTEVALAKTEIQLLVVPCPDIVKEGAELFSLVKWHQFSVRMSIILCRIAGSEPG